jgi:hypothetical protein
MTTNLNILKMKKILLSIVALMATVTTNAQFTANPAQLQIAEGETKELIFSLKTDVEVTAYQMYIQCPDGIEIATRMNDDEEEELSIDVVGNRHKTSHKLTTGKEKDVKGSYMISASSDKSALLRETEGEVFKVTFKAIADVNGAITINRALAGTPEGQKFKFDDFEIMVSPDAINSITADETKSGIIYNVAGQRVSKAAKGVYVIDGKKYVVK